MAAAVEWAAAVAAAEWVAAVAVAEWVAAVAVVEWVAAVAAVEWVAAVAAVEWVASAAWAEWVARASAVIGGRRVIVVVRVRVTCRCGGRTRRIVAISALPVAIGAIAISGRRYYATGYPAVAATPDVCTGVTAEGCELRLQDVPMDGGGNRVGLRPILPVGRRPSSRPTVRRHPSNEDLRATLNALRAATSMSRSRGARKGLPRDQFSATAALPASRLNTALRVWPVNDG